MKGDLDDIDFRKVCILPDLGNWWINMYLCDFEIQIVHHILQLTNRNMGIHLLDIPDIARSCNTNFYVYIVESYFLMEYF